MPRKGNTRQKGQKVHSWINFPNQGKRKCTVCGCIKIQTTRNDSNCVTYERDGVIYEHFIDCK